MHTSKRSRTFRLALFASALAFPACPGNAGPVEKNPRLETSAAWEAAWSTTLFGGGVKTNDEYTDGNLFLTVPLYSTIGTDGTLGGDYVFIEPYTSVGSGGEVAASLGLAWRHLFSREPVSALHKEGDASFMEEGWFVGASLFVDMLDTESDNRFWQLGLGAEIGNRYIELRGNYYIPLTDRKHAARQVSTRSFSNSSTQYRLRDNSGDPYATGNEVRQFADQTTFATTTTRTTTLRTVTDIYEEGMEGWDVELALLVPRLDRWMDVRLIGGYYSFDNQPFGPQSFGAGNVHGWKAGVEIRPVPAVALTAMWYEDERLTGDNWTVGVQFQIPLDRSWRDAFKPRRRHLVEHLAEPVHRQNNAINIGHEKEEHTTSTTRVKRVTRVVSQKKGQIVLADDIVFVNNGAAVGNGIEAGNDATGDGTAEAPMATVQAGANIAQGNSNATTRTWNVYTQGTAGGYMEDVTANLGAVNFIGSGRGIMGLNGKSFGTGPAPRVQGRFRADDISYFGITAYHVDQPMSAGIRTENVTRVLIDGNRVTDTSSIGIWVNTSGGGVTTAVVMDNTVVDSMLGSIRVDSEDTSQLTAFVNDNRTVNGTSAIGAFAYDDSNLQFFAAGNQMDNPGLYGIDLGGFNSAVLDATLTSNKVTSPGLSGMIVFGHQDANIDVTAMYNEFSALGEHGARFETEDDSDIFATLTGNTVTHASMDGFSLESRDFSTMHLNLYNNILDGAGDHGVHALSAGPVNIGMNVVGNRLEGASGSGILVEGQNISVTSLFATDNDIISPGEHGIHVLGTAGFTMAATIRNNRISSPGGGFDGIRLETHSNVSLTGEITSNVVVGANNGIRLDANGDSLLDTSVQYNLSAGNSNANMFMWARDNATLTANVLRNQFLQAPNNNASMINNGTGTLTSIFAGNNLSNTFNAGLYIEGSMTGSTNVALIGNTFTSSGDQALFINGLGSALMHVTFDGNSVSDAANLGGAQITVTESLGNTTFNGAINNVIGPTSGGGLTLDSVGGPSGTVNLNGVNIVLPVDVP